eukprot:TRINITY_DN6297_c0_g1_i2.p1 TRINITY_DN6297_c0_g1~~TRINITY_DN6297_c0_g1_i2.p1  ORF type:complete len:817 (+),score=108.98 TRINITY_DN6297_c0_g1_i2:51-2501(+)
MDSWMTGNVTSCIQANAAAYSVGDRRAGTSICGGSGARNEGEKVSKHEAGRQSAEAGRQSAAAQRQRRGPSVGCSLGPWQMVAAVQRYAVAAVSGVRGSACSGSSVHGSCKADAEASAMPAAANASSNSTDHDCKGAWVTPEQSPSTLTHTAEPQPPQQGPQHFSQLPVQMDLLSQLQTDTQVSSPLYWPDASLQQWSQPQSQAQAQMLFTGRRKESEGSQRMLRPRSLGLLSEDEGIASVHLRRSASAGPHVLCRSRRLFSQRVEREVRSAYDAETGTNDYLSVDSLPRLLARLHCIPCDGADSERLCAALRGWLDPRCTGYVDALTLIVFFQVLLGTGIGDFAERSSAGRRIDEVQVVRELLTRFEPRRVRGEFRDLYRHRMHHFAGSGHRSEATFSSPRAAFHGEVSPKLNICAAEVEESRRDNVKSVSSLATTAAIDLGELSCSPVSREEQLLHWKQDVEAKREVLRTQRSAEELVECTFQPRVLRRYSPREREASPLGRQHRDGEPILGSKRGCSVYHALYTQARIMKERQNERTAAFNMSRTKAELRGCTFKPNVARSAGSYHQAVGAVAQYPRGYHESSNRLRFGAKLRAEALRMEEERMHKIHPLSSPLLSEVRPPGRASANTADVCSGVVAEPSAGAAISSRLPCVREAASAEEAAAEEEACLEARRLHAAGLARSRSACASARTCASTGAADATVLSEAWPPVDMGALGEEESSRGKQGRISSVSCSDADVLAPSWFHVEVRTHVDRPPVLLEVRHGDTARGVAASFAAEHVLPPDMAQRLFRMLEQQMATVRVGDWHCGSSTCTK